MTKENVNMYYSRKGLKDFNEFFYLLKLTRNQIKSQLEK